MIDQNARALALATFHASRVFRPHTVEEMEEAARAATALTDATLLTAAIANAGMNYKATVWQGAVKTSGVVTAITATSITVAGTPITKSAITAMEAGPY